MAVSCDDFLLLVKDSIDIATKEMEYRNIVSRAYYSSYHRVKNKLKNIPNRHSELIDYLCDADGDYREEAILISAETQRKIGLLLEQEKKKRVTADYYLNKNISKWDAEISIKHAEKFKEMIDSL